MKNIFHPEIRPSPPVSFRWCEERIGNNSPFSKTGLSRDKRPQTYNKENQT